MRPKRDPGGGGALVSIKAGIVGEEPRCRWRRPLLPFTPIGQDICRDRAVAAEEPMPPEQPQIARLRYGMLGQLRRIVGVRQPLRAVREQIAEFKLAEPGQRQVEAAEP